MSSIRERLLNGIDSGDFLDVATRLYQDDWKNCKEIGKEVANLHNEGSINVLDEFLNLKNDDQNHLFFTTRNIFEDALPDFEASVLDVMKCVKHLTEGAGQDMEAGMLLSPFIDFCEKDSLRPREVLELAIEDNGQWRNFISQALIAGARINLKDYVNRSIELSKHHSKDIGFLAVFSMGRIAYGEDMEAIAEVVEALTSIVKGPQDDQLFASTLKSAIAMYKYDNSKEADIVEIVSSALNNPGDTTLRAASQVLMFEKADLPDAVIALFLTAFEYVNPEHRATLDNLDYGLEILIRKGLGRQAVNLIELLVLKHRQALPLAAFDSFSREIVKNRDGILSWTVTRWLLSNEFILGWSLREMIRDNLVEKSELSADLTQLDEQLGGGCLCLAKRVCGWFFYKPVCAVSYMMSLIEVSTEEETREIGDLIFNPLLISYPGSVGEYFGNLTANTYGKTEVVADDLIKRLKEYHDGLKSVQSIKELKLSIAQREAYDRKMNRELNASYKQAQKNSILGSLFGKPSILLYGNSSIYYVHHEPEGEPARQEMPLQSISTSVEFPSLECLDRHSLEVMLFKFRREGCH